MFLWESIVWTSYVRRLCKYNAFHPNIWQYLWNYLNYPKFYVLISFKFLYGRVRHSIFSDSSSLGFLFQKWFDWVLKFPGLAHIFLELVYLYF